MANPNSLEYFGPDGAPYPFIGVVGNQGLEYFGPDGKSYAGLFTSTPAPAQPAQEMIVLGMLGTTGRI